MTIVIEYVQVQHSEKLFSNALRNLSNQEVGMQADKNISHDKAAGELWEILKTKDLVVPAGDMLVVLFLVRLPRPL